jgi:DedD protein
MSSLSTHEELVLLRKRARRRLVGAIALVVTSTAVLWTVVGRIPNRPMKPESVQISASNLSSAPVAKAEVKPLAASATEAQSAQTASASPATELTASLEQQPAPVATPTPSKTVPQPKAGPVEPAPALEQLMEPIKPKASKPTRVEEPVAAKPKPHAKPVEKPKAVEQVAEPKSAAEPKHKKSDPAAILEGRAESEQVSASHKADAESEHKAGFVVQLAALSDPAKADALKAKLSANGIAARFSKVETSKGEVTRVRVGPFASREEADAALRRLAKAGVTGIVVSQ